MWFLAGSPRPRTRIHAFFSVLIHSFIPFPSLFPVIITVVITMHHDLAFPLLDLPHEILPSICMLVPDNGPLRLTCTQLRSAINLATTRMQSRTTMAALEGINLGPFINLHTLNFCGSTTVTGLSPLTACTGLRDLNCHNTAVRDLSPLAACTGLCNLN